MAGTGKRWQGPGPGRTRAQARRRAASAPPGDGWGLPTLPRAGGDAVVALFTRDALPRGLAALHGTGRGHLARVLDAGRGDLAAQLQRAGVPPELGLPDLGPDAAVVVVNATAQADAVGDLLLGAGAREVRVVARGAAPAGPESATEVPHRDGMPSAADGWAPGAALDEGGGEPA